MLLRGGQGQRDHPRPRRGRGHRPGARFGLGADVLRLGGHRRRRRLRRRHGLERARPSGPSAAVVATERTWGPAGARNRALREATGELVAFLDADDEWLPTYLEPQVARYDAERGARRSRPSGSWPATRASAARGPLGAPTSSSSSATCCRAAHLERVLRRNLIYISALVPREAGEEVGGFDEDLFGTEDHDLWMRILERGHRAVLSREALCVYHQPKARCSSNVARQAANNQRPTGARSPAGACRPTSGASRARSCATTARWRRSRRPCVDRRAAARSARRCRARWRSRPPRPTHWGEWARARGR